MHFVIAEVKSNLDIINAMIARPSLQLTRFSLPRIQRLQTLSALSGTKGLGDAKDAF